MFSVHCIFLQVLFFLHFFDFIVKKSLVLIQISPKCIQHEFFIHFLFER